ncbi:hypothetical protein C8C83_5543 [Flavobacterium sp. 90]|uniref:hypothetical protein n=1 Tax=unclassified Flavobacterium TaxID=196869 RepID=UPI000EB267AE|nr:MULTISPECIES: hypothetical protein [unclassified Flavobacterium]RKR08305.1 hypothetical protein C8C82_0173 [Flavobacterium sp. 81]TCK57493.1 hypothetical protein C8C83_5543 [Flavobacterium sp. 90]
MKLTSLLYTINSLFSYQTFIKDSNSEALFTSAISLDAINGDHLIKVRDKNNCIDTNAND